MQVAIFKQSVGISVTAYHRPQAGRTLESQCISLSRQWHECIHERGDKTDLPVVWVVLLAEMCSKIER
jgi:hypothetical protein